MAAVPLLRQCQAAGVATSFAALAADCARAARSRASGMVAALRFALVVGRAAASGAFSEKWPLLLPHEFEV